MSVPRHMSSRASQMLRGMVMPLGTGRPCQVCGPLPWSCHSVRADSAKPLDIQYDRALFYAISSASLAPGAL